VDSEGDAGEHFFFVALLAAGDALAFFVSFAFDFVTRHCGAGGVDVRAELVHTGCHFW